MRNGYGISALVFAATSLLPLAGCGSSSGAATLVSGCSNITYAAPSGAANNIVFTLDDKAYTCGQYANGDWWVAPQTNGGSVTITSITPAASGGVNGFMVNPASIASQAWDNRSVVPYSVGLMPALPLTINTTTTPVSSVVKVVSLAVPSNHQNEAFAAVLTVVNASISNSSTYFRPGFFGTTGKTSYAVPVTLPSQVGYYSVGGSVPAMSSLTFSSIATRYQNFQLDYGGGYPARDLHPADNIPVSYGAQIATDNETNLERMLLSDFSYSNPTDKAAMINYLQMAIDLKSVAANAGSGSFPAAGGHGNGRKLPLLFANMVFGGTDFSNAVTAAAPWSEDGETYRSNVTGEALWGTGGNSTLNSTNDGAYWLYTQGFLAQNPSPTGAHDVADPYGQIDGGGMWVLPVYGGYEFCCTAMPLKYHVLGEYMLGLVTPPTYFPNPATDNVVEFVERWVNYGVKSANKIITMNPIIGGTPVVTAQSGTVCARPALTTPSSEVYGSTYGLSGGTCVPGTNNWASVDGTATNGGYYGSVFGDQLWSWYR